MTKRDKVALLSSVALAAAVTVTAVVFAVRQAAQGQNGVIVWLYPAFLMALGIASVAAVYYLKVKKRGYEKLLNAAYYKAYEIIKTAAANSQLSAGRKREIKEDILEMLLCAQKAGRNVEGVTGDPAALAQRIIKAYAKPGQAVLFGLIDGFIAFILYILGVSAVLNLEQPGAGLFTVGIDASLVIFFIVLALIVLPATKKLSSGNNPWMFMLPLSFGIAFVLLSMFLRKMHLADAILDRTVVMIPNIAALIGYMAGIPALMLLKAAIRKRRVRSA